MNYISKINPALDILLYINVGIQYITDGFYYIYYLELQ